MNLLSVNAPTANFVHGDFSYNPSWDLHMNLSIYEMRWIIFVTLVAESKESVSSQGVFERVELLVLVVVALPRSAIG